MKPGSKYVMQTCNRCGEYTLDEKPIVHKEWCGRTWMVDAQGMLHAHMELRTIRWEVVNAK